MNEKWVKTKIKTLESFQTWKLICNLAKYMGQNEGGLKRQVHRTESLHTKLEWSHVTNLTLDSFRTNGRCLIQKVRPQEVIKISAEINKNRNE